jgi:hypothetical protein
MRLRRKSKSRKRRIAEAAGTYLKFKAISKFAKGARKTITGLAAYKTAKGAVSHAPAPVKALPVVAGVGAAGAVAARKRRREPTAA